MATAAVADRIVHLPPFPKSWYVVGLSRELKVGQIRELSFCGKQVVLYRTQAGKAVLAEAFCPHMGAHFAHGGKVEGELLRCPFHGFCFDPTGTCTETGYGTRPPAQAKLGIWPTQEWQGLILAWHDNAGSMPDWQIPDMDFEGWSEPQFADWTIASHPQEIAENSVDIGHFRYVHGYDEVKVFEEAQADGPVLYGKYGMARMANFVGKNGRMVHIEFDFKEFGLGFAFVEATVQEYGLVSRHFVLPMPIDGKVIQLRIGVSVKMDFDPKLIHPLLGLVPRPVLNYFLLKGYFREYTRDVTDDFNVWKNKAYVHPPYLAKGDGPVVLYRKWAQQFYE